jgi:Cys-tRNA(Pro) deacylase
MTKPANFPMTPAVRELQAHGVEFEPCLYKYEEKGGTERSAQELGVEEHAVIKTLIMETDTRAPLIVLMHGDMQVSTKQLARVIAAKSVVPCKPEVADKHSGYKVGGTSPFGTKKLMPVYMEETIAALDRIYINGGGRGFLVAISPADLVAILKPTWVNVGIREAH